MHRDVIGRQQQPQPQKGQQPIGTGRPLPLLVACKQGNGAGCAHLPEPPQKQQRKDCRKRAHRSQDGLQGKEDVHAHRFVQQVEQGQFGQFGKQHADRQARRQGYARYHGGFKQHDARDVAPVHAQNVVQAKFSLPAAHQEGMGAEQEDHRKQRDHRPPKTECAHHHAAPAHGGNRRALKQKGHHGIHAHHAHTGEEIGDIKPAVFTDSIPGQACIKPKLHSRSPPVASMVSVSEIF